MNFIVLVSKFIHSTRLFTSGIWLFWKIVWILLNFLPTWSELFNLVFDSLKHWESHRLPTGEFVGCKLQFVNAELIDGLLYADDLKRVSFVCNVLVVALNCLCIQAFCCEYSHWIMWGNIRQSIRWHRTPMIGGSTWMIQESSAIQRVESTLAIQKHFKSSPKFLD